MPLDYDQELYNRFLDCTQEGKIVDDFTIEFMRLCSQNDLDDNEGQQIAHYIHGMR